MHSKKKTTEIRIIVEERNDFVCQPIDAFRKISGFIIGCIITKIISGIARKHVEAFPRHGAAAVSPFLNSCSSSLR